MIGRFGVVEYADILIALTSDVDFHTGNIDTGQAVDCSKSDGSKINLKTAAYGGPAL